MIPVAVEPSRLSFDLNNSSTPASEFRGLFLQFVKELQTFLRELEDCQMRIAVTVELKRQYAEYIPVQSWTDDALAKLATEAFQRRLIQYTVPVGRLPGIQVDFTDGISKNHLYNHVFYTKWREMLGICLQAPVLAGIVKSSGNNTVFISSQTCIASSDGRQRCLPVTDNPRDLSQSPEASLLQLAQTQVLDASTVTHVPCRGTGTHGSMWGNGIRRLADVPHPERELLEKIIATGQVKEIKLLAFPQNMDPLPTPCLIIQSVESGRTSDFLNCILRGRGTRQNCQELKLELNSGIGELFSRGFDGLVTVEKLSTFSYLKEAASR